MKHSGRENSFNFNEGRNDFPITNKNGRMVDLFSEPLPVL